MKLTNVHDLARFTDKIDATSSCWEWTAKRSPGGYGVFWFDGKNRRASRVSYTTFVGPIPGGLVVRHLCHNPPCVNPEHLLVGTNKENSQDSAKANRMAFGERNGNSALTASQVRSIRSEYVPRKVSRNKLAAKFGVDKSTIDRVLAKQVWRRA